MIDIIIPHCAVDDYRNRNLFFVVKYYKEYLPNANIIIIEQNTETDITEINDLVNTHFKIKTEEPLFCKSLLLNEGYNISKNKLLIFNDNDCILHPNIMYNINGLIDIWNKHLILPYNRPVINLNEYQTINLIKKHKDFSYGALDLIKRPFQSNGGIVMISSENYYNIGGHDPRFIGWGGEDDAFFVKGKNVLGLVRLDYDLVHMNHSKGVNDGASNPHYPDNFNFYKEYLDIDNKKIINDIGFKHLIKHD
jgi:predicted glycosyltransferase involved in capsule biosynthesis